MAGVMLTVSETVHYEIGVDLIRLDEVTVRDGYVILQAPGKHDWTGIVAKM